MKNVLESTRNTTYLMDKSISELKDRNLEMIKVEEGREESFNKYKRILWELSDSIRNSNIRIMGIPRGQKRKKGTESLLDETIDGGFPNLGDELEIWVQEANSTLSYLNAKRPYLRHIILKLSKVNNKERILKALRWGKRR